MNIQNFHLNPILQSKTPLTKMQDGAIINIISPKKSFENINNLNNRLQSPKRQSLSPLKFRKKKNSSMQKSKQQFKKKNKFCCNHSHKIGNYSIKSQFEIFFYCKSCAVRLASQGFDVGPAQEKVNILNMNRIDNEDQNERAQEINKFVDNLQHVIQNLTYKQIQINTCLIKRNSIFENQITKIKQHYSQFYQIISEHENRVIQQLKRQYQTCLNQVDVSLNKIDQALKHSKLMRNDIIQSINEVVLQAPENQFRPIMFHYQNNLQKFTKLLKQKQPQIKIKKLIFRDSQDVFGLLLQNMQVYWQDDKKFCYQSQNQGSINDQFQKFLSGKKQKRRNTLLSSIRIE